MDMALHISRSSAYVMHTKCRRMKIYLAGVLAVNKFRGLAPNNVFRFSSMVLPYMYIHAVADPGFLQGGFKIHERAHSARENLTATPPFNKTTPF